MSWLYDEARREGVLSRCLTMAAARRCLSGATTGICWTPTAMTTA